MDDRRDLAALARGIFAAALAAADPSAFTREALRQSMAPADLAQRGRRHWILALGKAAPAMARAALRFCEERKVTVAGGLVVASEEMQDPHPALPALVGDHPLPGRRSLLAAERLAVACEAMGTTDVVLACISGGTSSLVGAPVNGVSADDLATLNGLLLASGLDVVGMNAVRKRFTRWGAGRLAAALVPRTVHLVLLSDVPGDDPAVIGSGPCAPDVTTAADVERIVRDAGFARQLPLSLAAYLGAVRSGAIAETPKPGSVVFRAVRAPVVGGNRSVLAAAAREATALHVRQVVVDERPLAGDARDAGRAIARAALAAPPGTCLILGGETTVTLPARHGDGGRNQQLALAAAQLFAEAGHTAPRVALLSCGTDGRDGPTDAAGAIVTNETWSAIRAAGLDPAAHLERCDAHPALDAVRALVRTGNTGTNVADVVVALRE